MIKLEHVVLASPEQMEFIIEGMRNPMNSWEKSDSEITYETYEPWDDMSGGKYTIGTNDHSLMQRLANNGPVHRKYMRMIPVYVRITAPLYWWKEFDTYKVGTVANSCSTMHKIQEKEFTLEDFSTEHLNNFGISDLRDVIIRRLNQYRWIFIEWDSIDDNSKNAYGMHEKKDTWWQMIQLLPSSYNQTRNVMLNYEVLANIYEWRKNHKLDEWREFCKWIEELPYSELIVGRDIVMTPNEIRIKMGLEPLLDPKYKEV